MRTPTRFLHLGALSLSGLLTGLLTFSGCSDSLHLDPEPLPGTGGASTGGGGGAGGEGPIACVTSSDCPAPKAVCDTVKRECVECLEFRDCAFRPGTVCSQGRCDCPKEGESFCEALGAEPDRCVDTSTSSTNCGTCGYACFGACNMGQCADAWEPTSLVGAPSARFLHNAVWTGSTMIVWGGATQPNGTGNTNTGGVYDLAKRSWTPTSMANAPSPRQRATAVWTGMRMIVWGGFNGAALGDGGTYDPVTNTWTALPKASAPSPRYHHTAVWSGTSMVLWGGFDGANLGDGAAYNPAANTWTPVNAGGAPTARREHVAVATAGSSMLVFGGFGFDVGMGFDTYLADGAVYNPVGDTWTGVAASAAPPPRTGHTAVWTGSDVPVWGGHDGASFLSSGSEYNLISTTWSLMNDPSPSARRFHTAVWIGDPVSRMAMWGGEDSVGVLNSGSLYNPVNNLWDKEMPTAPAARSLHTAVVAGTRMIIWGGKAATALTDTGGVLDAAALQ